MLKILEFIRCVLCGEATIETVDGVSTGQFSARSDRVA